MSLIPRKASVGEVPILDLGPLVDGGDIRSLARDLRAACEGTAFFYIRNHGVPAGVIDARLAAAVPGGVGAALAGFHYDTALRAHPAALAATLQVLTVAQLLFGTDAPLRVSADQLQGLLDHGFSAAELHAIECGNAQRLLPRWKPAA